jgi:bifunctional non-homologous end joining protein LigD
MKRLASIALRHGPCPATGCLTDLLHLDGEDITGLPAVDRKTRLEAFMVGAAEMLRYNDHQIGQGPTFYQLACQHGLEGIVSKPSMVRTSLINAPG